MGATRTAGKCATMPDKRLGVAVLDKEHLQLSWRQLVKLVVFVAGFVIGSGAFLRVHAVTIKPQVDSYYAAHDDPAATDYTITNDARFDEFGAAQRFHIFTNYLTSGNSFSGNVATQEINLTSGSFNAGGGDFHDIATEQPYYFGKVDALPQSPGLNTALPGAGVTTNPFIVFGPDVKLTDNHQPDRIQVNNSDVTGMQASTVIRQVTKDPTTYLDFASEFGRLTNLSATFAAQAQTRGAVEDTAASDSNHRVYDVTGAKPSYPIVVNKAGDAGEGLAGVAFDLYNNDGTRYLDAAGKPVVLKTDDYGQARYAMPQPGTYQVKEVQAPSGYQLDTAMHQVKANQADAIYLNMTAATALGASGSLSQLIIKGISTAATTDNAGTVIINVDCSDYSLDKTYSFPNVILEDANGKQLDNEAADSRVIWNYYNVPAASKMPADPTGQFGDHVLKIGNDIIAGTILAPTANVVLTAHLHGMIAANSVDMNNNSSVRMPLTMRLFNGGNDITVANTKLTQEYTDFTVTKKWAPLAKYLAPYTDHYPDLQLTLTANGIATNVKLPLTTHGSSGTAVFAHLPVYEPKANAALNLSKTRLLQDWVAWKYSPYLITDLAEERQLSALDADPSKPIKYSVTETLGASSVVATNTFIGQLTDTVNTNNQQSASLTNRQYGLQVQKFGTDSGSEPLAATFTLTKATGGITQADDKTATLTSNDNDTQALSPGAYTIEETQSPPGYRRDATRYHFTLSQAGEWTTTDGQPLPTTAPSATGFWVTGTNLLHFKQVDPPVWQVKLIKHDVDHQPVAGATFTLSASKQTLSQADGTLTTDTQGLGKTAMDLGAGTYTLVETAAPKDYAPQAGQATITLADTGAPQVSFGGGFDATAKIDGHVITITVAERKKGQLPVTGGTGWLWPVVIGLSAALLGGGLMIRFRNGGEGR